MRCRKASRSGTPVLEFLCLELVTGEIPSPGTGPWLGECTPEALIDTLWNVGFLLAEASRDNGGGQAIKTQYLGVHQALRINRAAAQHFQVHPMFRSYLATGGPG